MKYQTSEHYTTAWILAVVGGILDAYTYICRGNVFANAQTGNIVLMGANLAEGKFGEAVNYLYPILAFTLGILICEKIKSKYGNNKKLHWRQLVIVIELLGVTAVGFIPLGKGDLVVNATVAFVCALQVQAFRKVRGNAFASTMCTGNLRSATERLHIYMESKDKKYLNDALHYYGVIGFFIIGAAIGAVASKWLGMYAVFTAVLGLIAVCILMTKEYIK